MHQNEQPCGVATCITYLVFQPMRFSLPLLSPEERWALTPQFHPYPSTRSGRYIFCGTFCVPLPGPFPLGSMVLCVARTFLPMYSNQATSRSARFKNSLFYWTIKEYRKKGMVNFWEEGGKGYFQVYYWSDSFVFIYLI